VGAYHLRQGRHDLARGYLESVIVAHEQRMNFAAVGGAWFQLADVEFRAGNRIAAESALEKALGIARDGSNVLFQCWILPLKARCAVRFGDHPTAERAVDEGFALLTSGEDWRGLPAPLHVARAMLAASQRRWRDAEADFDVALAIDRRYGCVHAEAVTLMEYARMQVARAGPDDGARAREHLDRAVKIFKGTDAVGDFDEANALLGRL
jgi:tetratricopeptide (TPR) repeat protein